MKKFLNITVEKGSLADLDSIIDLGILFFDESNFKHLTCDPVRFKEVVTNAVSDEEMCIDVARCEGHVVGFSLWAWERYYTVEHIASIFLLYIHPKFRGKGIDRALTKFSTARAESMGAAVFYSASTAGIADTVDRKMENMLAKQGFELLGKFGRKVLNGESS